MQKESISLQTIKRLPLYAEYLKRLPDDITNISATSIAADIELNDVQVRKDLASVCSGGRPRTGYNRKKLLYDIQRYLGYHDENTAVLVGMGNLGRALYNYGGFREYGLDIAVTFDNDKNIVGKVLGGKQVMDVSRLKDLCGRLHVKIGIIAVPSREAQHICDIMVQSGITAIWNFAPAYLSVPKGVLVQNENIASSLAVLSNHLKQNKELEQRN
jgi:redox-sensing transcriptional repressor